MMDEPHGEWEWPATPLGRQLAQLEKSLGCPICGNIISVPKIISKCGHFFCSECVQRSLDFKAECPSCRCKVAGAHELVAARTLEDACQALQQSRQQLLDLLQDAQSTAKGRLSGTGKSSASSGYKPSLKRVAKLNYAMIKDAKLREALAQEGLPTHGSKETLVWRHREYTRLHNIQLDAKNPLSHRAIVQEVMKREEGRMLDQRNARMAEAIAHDVISNKQSSATKKANKQYAEMIKKLKAAKQQQQHSKAESSTSADKEDDRQDESKHNEVSEASPAQDSAEQNGVGAEEATNEEEYESEQDDADAEGSGSGVGADWLAWRIVVSSRLRSPIYFNTRRDTAQAEPPEELVLEPDAETLAVISAQLPTVLAGSSSTRKGRSSSGSATKKRSMIDADDEDFGLTPSSQASQYSTRSQSDKRTTPHRSATKQQQPTEPQMTPVKTPDVIAIPGDDEWSCQRCTYFNKHDVTTCEMCGWVLPSRASRSASRISSLATALNGAAPSSSSSKRHKRSL